MMAIYKEMGGLVYEGAKEVESAIHCLKDPVANKGKITRACGIVTAIEHKADEIYFTGISELFEKKKIQKS